MLAEVEIQRALEVENKRWFFSERRHGTKYYYFCKIGFLVE
jgi:hypothetical protein